MKPQPIADVARALGLSDADVEPCGWFKGKFALVMAERLANRPRGKYVAVTAINPTPLGEGKTVVAIGLAMALCRSGRPAICTLREPSLGPVFGIKGGGAGAGCASLLPADDINLHFTGDLHAVTSANNLLAAMIDNHVGRRLEPRVDPATVTWQRALDMNDRGLAHIVSGLGSPRAPLRETGFDLTAASEVMAILALAADVSDLRARLGRIVVGFSPDARPITAEMIGAAGAMAALLRDAIRPNLVQTCEHTPAIVHAGPFGNIAHGNSSIIADRIALRLAEYVITESGFGADCGAEKFVHIKCRASGLVPDAFVLVCTVRALKVHSGRFPIRPGKPLPRELAVEDLDALRAGAANLQAHLEILQRFGVPVVVAVNRFPTDTARELLQVQDLARQSGAASVSVTDCFATGSEGAGDLADAVADACQTGSALRMLYPLEATLREKFTTIAQGVYGADGVDFTPDAQRQVERLTVAGYGILPVCIAKTQYSFSHDPNRLGRPREFRIPIHDVRLAAGAGYVYGVAGEILTMPALPSKPAALRIDMLKDGQIMGLI